MFERFTPDARQLLVAAQAHANAQQHSFLTQEHLLLATLEVARIQPDSTCGAIYTRGGAPLEELRELIEGALERGEAEARTAKSGLVVEGTQPFSVEAKKVLELALREALQLGHNYIADFHILLALIRAAESSGPGEFATLIDNAGLNLESAREVAVAQTRETRPAARRSGRRGRRAEPEVPATPGFDAVLERTIKPGGRPRTTGDLLLALLDEADTHAAAAAAFLGFPDRSEFVEFLSSLTNAGVPDGSEAPQVSIDKHGAITIRDLRITELLQTPVGSLTPEESAELDDRMTQAIRAAQAKPRE